MRTLTNLFVGLGSSLVLTLVACGGGGSSTDSGFGPPQTDNFTNGTTPGIGSGTPPAANLAACATSSAAATPKPVYLVFAYDKSGSMQFSSKWDSCKTAMEGFFTSTDSTGINASLTFFPSDTGNICDQTQYAKPQVDVTALPSPAFGAAIDATGPNGDTPTLGAISGSMTYAQALAAGAAKDGTVAVVMVTDGYPENCSDNHDVGPASAVAAANAKTIPTYVIGVGSDLSDLNQIAAAGGTKSAFVVSVTDPAQTQTDLANAIHSIANSQLSCDYAIPAAPSGDTFDRSKVNVQYTAAGAAATSIGHNPTCDGGTGWKYDDENNPQRVVVCDTTCNQIKAQAGKVDLVFGCSTVAVSVK